MLLQGGDGHHALVRVEQVSAGLVGLHLAGALHQNAGDDLQAVGDAVLELLQKHRLFPQHVVLEPLGDARVCDV
jgi:hypothetical protein